MRFNARKAGKSAASHQRRLKCTIAFSVVARATTNAPVVYRALKRTAKFITSLAR
ncbi:MAG TPA: hypothetical protein VGB02_16755 [Pyrinomonadaceae bacterium]